MKILVHHHKYGDAYYDATDELWAFGELFKSLDEFEAYFELADKGSTDDKDQEDLYEAAKKGDLKAAKKLCQIRKDYEYEGYSIDQISMKPVGV